jgi:hypothetical protein
MSRVDDWGRILVVRTRVLGSSVVVAALSLVLTSACDATKIDSAEDDPPGARRATLEELLADIAAPRHPSDGGGRAWLEADGGGAPSTVASATGRWTIVYEAGPLGVAEGGAVRFIVSPFWYWSPAQTVEPGLPGYTTVETDAEGVELEVSVPSYVDIKIAGRALEPGERIRIVYGAGEAGATADRFAEADSRFWVGVDGDGDGVHKLIEHCPGLAVVPGPAAQLVVVLPSTARPAEPITVRVAVLDAAANAGVPFHGPVQLAVVPEGPDLPATVELQPADRGVKTVQARIGAAGVYRVFATAALPGAEGRFLEALSNPVVVDDSDTRVLWGDLHGHTALSDGTGNVEGYLSYARDVAGLDVVAVTDHDHWGFVALDDDAEAWAAIEKEVQSFNDPGRFVTLLGYEWTNWIHGHRHVLYFGAPGEVLSSVNTDFDTPPELWEALRGREALTFAHHSAGGPVPINWDFAPDPELEPVTEICSVHGSSEAPDSPGPIYDPLPGNYVRDALDRGYRLGFVGSGDSHDGHPGLVQLAGGNGGLAALLSPELTREGVYRALKARRTYATNGPRIVLRAALDGRPIGFELVASEVADPALLYVRAVTSAPIERVDVIRSGSVVQSVSGSGAFDFETTFELAGLRSGEYVYLRVVQVDGGAAWCTPFFVS